MIMGKIYLYIFLFISFVCCKNTTTENMLNDSDIISNKEKLHVDLLKELEYFRKEDAGFSGYENSITNIGLCYTMEFLREKEDSIVIISYKMCNKDYIGYKGILDFIDYYVAILDSDNIGLYFYDNESIINIKIEELKCINSDVQVFTSVKIKGIDIESKNRWDGAIP
jgi:hypothetical protein